MIVQCKNCKIRFNKLDKEIKRSSNHFCSKSCSATFNNKTAPKRKLKRKCADCDTLVSKSSKYCALCYKVKQLKIDNMTIKEASYQNKWKSNKFTRIRDRARRMYTNLLTKCQNCGYDKHVEVCHKKELSSFPENTLVKTVNAPENIAILCRNCHWELDHGLINI